MRQDTHISGLALLRNPRWVEASYWRRHDQLKDQEARQALFQQYLPFAKKLAANQYFNRSRDNYELADLEQLALEALLESIDRFNASRGVPFTAFARQRIMGNISDGVAKMSEVGRQSQHSYQKEQDRLRSLKTEVFETEKRPIDKLRDLTVGLALGLMLEGTRLYVDDHTYSDNPDGYDGLVWKNMTKKVDTEVARLPDPQPFIIRQHYQNDVSFVQIAQILNLTKGRISQLHKKALTLLRKRIGKL